MVDKTNTQVARRASTPMIVSIPELRSTFKGSENLIVQRHVKYNRGAQDDES